MQYKPTPRGLRLLSTALCVAACASVRAAQPTSGSSLPEETIKLSPFTVEAGQDSGYVASSTLAGSRLNTALKDTAAALSVMTSEFMADVGATNLTEALQWANNTQLEILDATAIGSSVNDNGTYFNFDSFRVRGIPATVTRNYFPYRLGIDSYNVDRVEEARGPNSILFGIGSAGGVLNTQTKQAALRREFERASLSVASYGGYRGTIDVNRPLLNGRLAVRFNGVYNHAGSFREHAYADTRRANLAVTYQVRPMTRIRFDYEIGDSEQIVTSNNSIQNVVYAWEAAGKPLVTAVGGQAANTGLGLGRYANTPTLTYVDNSGALVNMQNLNLTVGGSFGDGIVVDESIAPYSINTGGPGALRNAYFHSLTAVIEHQLGRDTFLELGYNRQENNSRTFQPQGESFFLKADPNQYLRNGDVNPHAGQYFIEGYSQRWDTYRLSDNVRLSASTELDYGKWGHYRLAGMGEYEWRGDRSRGYHEVWAGRIFNDAPENTANRVFRRNYITPGDWGTYYRSLPSTHGLISNLPDPTGRSPTGTLSSEWVTDSSNSADDPHEQSTLMAGMQARYFKNRAVLFAGFRQDKLHITDNSASRDPVTQIWRYDYSNPTHYRYQGNTRTLGAAVHVTSYLSLYYNNSSNFSLPNGNVRILPDSTPAGNPEAEGQDYGIGLSLLQDRINLRATRYEVALTGGHDFRFGNSNSNPTAVQSNIHGTLVREGLMTQAEMDSRRLNSTGATFDRKVEGYELNIVANLTKNWRLQANYSYTDGYEDNIAPEVKAWRAAAIPEFQTLDQALITSEATPRPIGQVLASFENEFQNLTALEGQALPGNRQHKVSVFTRYTFSEGFLRGAYVGGGYRHQSGNAVGREGDDILYGNSFHYSDLLVGYRFPRVPSWLKVKSLSFQLNVSNLLDNTDPLIVRYSTYPRVRRAKVVDPRSWRLTMDVEF